ncbi:hypothetical protein K474DRAFT_1669012 [Panus rudis PR-1116 ss-1]|nr:hypothetical protein K474DRAFT_1669012 [Panus rudis PR-1116 ss-1]
MTSAEQSQADTQSPTTQFNQMSNGTPRRRYVMPAKLRHIRPVYDITSSRSPPTHVWGFIIPFEYKSRVVRQYFGQSGEEVTQEELDEFATDDTFLLQAGLAAPKHVREKIPGLLKPYPSRMLAGGGECIFPLADNGGVEAMNVKIPWESIVAVREELGLSESELPRWYRVTVHD